MGRNLLRRKILNFKRLFFIRPNRRFAFAAILLIFAALVRFNTTTDLYAEETETALGESVLSRPLRALRSPMPDHPANRGVLPANYTERSMGGESLLVTPQALENPLTRRYIRQFSGPGGLSWLSAVMKRAEPYIAFIRKEIAVLDLPPELVYLPVIESGFLASAVSRSGASGLWQFMRNSIAPFGMEVNDWIDERLDFWKSTRGALRKLDENYKYFGDWPLALAAYNAGLGAINRIVRQNGNLDYWALAEEGLLKSETANYVPKLIAASYILSNPRRFGIEPSWPEDPQWERIAVNRTVDLRLLAVEAGLDAGEIIRANQELLYNVTPPGGEYFLKIPAEYAGSVKAVLANTETTLVNYYIHTIRSGDTLLALALHYGITVEQITASNPGTQARYLRIGSRLLIPALRETGPYTRTQARTENISFEGTHLVKRGETLWSIALAYEIDPEALAEANGMSLNDILREGRILKTPIR